MGRHHEQYRATVTPTHSFRRTRHRATVTPTGDTAACDLVSPQDVEPHESAELKGTPRCARVADRIPARSATRFSAGLSTA